MKLIAFDYVRQHWKDISAEIGAQGLTRTPILTVDHAFETRRLDLQVHDVRALPGLALYVKGFYREGEKRRSRVHAFFLEDLAATLSDGDTAPP